jgi:hypothetical protein
MNINNQCYRHERISTHNKYDSQIIFPNVDMTYVLIMVGSKHEERVRRQLEDYPFTRNIYLQWNYGFRNCSKYLTKQKTDSDLSDAYMIVFSDAIQHNYNRILILEDDFVVNGITNIDKKNIYDFLEIYNPEILTLGSILISTSDKYLLNNNFLEVYNKAGTHAMIYNNNVFYKIYLQLYTKPISIDTIINIDTITSKVDNIYSYKLPLIIQLVSKTENSNTWHSNKFMLFLCTFAIWLLGLDNEKRYKKTYKLIHDIHFKKNYKILKKILNAISRKIYD